MVMMGSIVWAVLAAASVPWGTQQAPGSDRLYGRVVTAGGAVYEGFLRWDRNEGSWADLLNGSKEMPWENERDAERLDPDRDHRDRGGGISIFGLRISWSEEGENYPTSAASGIRFGHLSGLEVVSRERARLVLKSGLEVELEGGSTDLGEDLRGLTVDDPERGEVELRWRDLDAIEFMEAPADREPLSRRLYGTLTARGGQRFTGFVSWDVDEILGSDILDGEERGRDRKIPFDRIAAIERAGPSGAIIVLQNGEEVELRGSNDVNDSNRGISISDPALGQVQVGWDELESVTFEPAPADAAPYASFDGGRHLYGTVETQEGQLLTGELRWDNDEEYSWEILDGRDHDIDFDIELGNVASIRNLGSWGAEVTLLDGRTFELDDSNDVDDRNKGVFVTMEDGETVMIAWRDFREVRFERR
jgi:hypothetical protein